MSDHTSETATTPGEAPGAGSLFLNVLWVVLAGFWLCIAYVVFGVVLCLTVIGIPLGIQAFKLSWFALWPFGRTVVTRQGRSVPLSVVGNVVWLIFVGWELALVHLLTGLVLCLTVIGIPLGIANFKLIPLALLPFGKDIVTKGQPIHVEPTRNAYGRVIDEGAPS